MSLAYVSTYLPQHCGIATYTNYLIHGIKKVAPNLRITIIAEKGASRQKKGNFEVIPCWDRNEDYTELISTQVRNFDTVHIQHEYSIYKFDERLPRLLERLKGQAKLVITIHCVRPAQFSERGAEDEKFAQKIAHSADVVIVHLESQKAILERLGISSKKINVIPHGSELSDVDKKESQRRFGLPQDGKIILSFGFVKPHKCLHVMLEALKEIVDNDINAYLFVAGGLARTAGQKEKDYLEFVKRKTEKFNLQARVIFPNKFFPNEDVPYILGASDLVLFPYYEEDRSASGSFHLSIGARKPIIASRIPKFEELKNISDELLILPYNSSGIAKIALRLFQDQEFEDYVLKRTEDYRNKTSWVSVAKMHLELYKE
jgi:glycosyltransferase involved in cell wall biosynthesis